MANGATGSVTFVQRFGSILNLHPHIHSIIADGLFVPGPSGALDFMELPGPTQEELEPLTERVARRLTAVVERHTADDARTGALMEETVAALRDALSSSVRTPRLALDEEPPAPSSPLCARVAGFTLHAAQWVSAEDRDGLERLARYGLRSPFCQERLSRLDDGRVRYTLRRPWPRRGGVTELVLEPEAFLRRLAALTPAPSSHLVRYHGLFANRSTARRHLPLTPIGARASSSCAADASRRRSRRFPWAQLLMRVLSIDSLRCPRCATAMTVLALISDPPVVARILTHLGLPAQTPAIAPARVREGDDASLEGFFADVPWVDLETPVGEVDDDGPGKLPRRIDDRQEDDDPPP
jgi:hypothetical protein